MKFFVTCPQGQRTLAHRLSALTIDWPTIQTDLMVLDAADSIKRQACFVIAVHRAGSCDFAAWQSQCTHRETAEAHTPYCVVTEELLDCDVPQLPPECTAEQLCDAVIDAVRLLPTSLQRHYDDVLEQLLAWRQESSNELLPV